MAMPLAGKAAIVTGAGSGINLSFARALLSKHCSVLFADLSLRPEAQELVSRHSKSSRSPCKAVFQETDVREWDQLDRMFEVAKREFGDVDVVCPGAGVYEPPSSNFWYPPGHPISTDHPASNHFAHLDINLTHPIRTTQLALAYFLSTRSRRELPASKHVIHISSIAGQTTPFAAPIYNATKHGINGFVRSLAPLDKRLGIRVTAVAPGVIKTPLWTDHPEKLRLVTAADEWVTPEYVAEVMVSLLSEESVEVEEEAATAATTGSSAVNSRQYTRSVKVEGGMILEVAKGRARVVKQYNDPGPRGKGNTVGNMEVAEEEIFGRLANGTWGVD